MGLDERVVRRHNLARLFLTIDIWTCVFRRQLAGAVSEMA